MAPHIVPAIATLSLGRPECGHTLPAKIHAAKRVGFTSIEINYFCVAAYASETGKTLHEAAKVTRELLDELALEAVSLAPLMNFEGQVNRIAYKQKLVIARVWLELAHILRAPLVQIPACMLPVTDLSKELAIQDLAEVSDLASQYNPPIVILYEFTSWSTSIRDWQSALEVALKVNRPNFSICLDVYHIGTYLHHENTHLIPDPPQLPATGQQSLAESLAELKSTLHAAKFGLYQLTDAAPIPNPLPVNQPTQDPSAPGLQTMSRTNRPFPFTTGGLLPVLEISRAVLDMQSMLDDGTKCWWSMETFVPRAWSKDTSVPDELASIAWDSWVRVREELGIQ